MLNAAKPGERKIKVLIVDDSALIRSILKEIVNSQPDMEAVGAASNPLQAREMIKTYNPDVLTLDVEMPEMDGLTFLEKLMRLRPMPVLMISTLTERGSVAALRALELGAVDFLAKPRLGVMEGMQAYADEIADKIRAASRARLKSRSSSPAFGGINLPSVGSRLSSTEKLIMVGSSTGGTEALKEFLMPMPADAPAILIAQHMPEAFTKSFAERLNGLSKMTVSEAVHNERVLPGHAYLAPGHSHLLLKRSGSNYVIALSQSEPVNRHRPSVEVLFRSAAECAGENAIGVMLTGMGKDGAVGMLEMRQAGSYNFAQDEATCVVYGMPRAAVEIGAVQEIVPIHEMAQRVLSRVVGSGGRNRL
ncbi:MAG: chemotaxis response regulator protein-glutamate methylesterase [Gallionella sp.]|nr:chemotaxis response regulator protein-glutamate methylesterase [Gallionella sp.]MDD4945761.1 chemotaxis response regulator protein-glutamate methylesterase [Gallionella sp.]MDD5611813.1 chemotaxis response regulator protein-glutamate methylesterase [Gallionella sp.]